MGGDLAIQLRWLPHGYDLPLPKRQSAGAAGFDLCAALPPGSDHILMPGQRGLVPCGFCLALPNGYEAQVRPRSGLALRHGVTVLNAPGTIDSDFRGELAVLLINLGAEPYSICRGDRIAQLVVAPVQASVFEEVEFLDDTDRAASGFGSTGER